MNIEERGYKAQEFLNDLKEQVFTDEIFTKLFTAEGTLQEEIEKNIINLNTTLKIYKETKERARMFPIDPYAQGQYTSSIHSIETALLNYEKLCIREILPTLKQKLIELPNKLQAGKVQLNQTALIEESIKGPPLELKVTSPKIPKDFSSDKRANAFKEKINRALEWIEIPLKIGKGVEKFLSEYGSTIVSATSGVLKLLIVL